MRVLYPKLGQLLDWGKNSNNSRKKKKNKKRKTTVKVKNS